MTAEVSSEPADQVVEPIAREPHGKNLLSMHQLTEMDIRDYIYEAAAAEALLRVPGQFGVQLLPGAVLKAVMRQPSTRTGGSMTTAMAKLGGFGELISGMQSSAEAKGETVYDSWLAFAAQADILGIRTVENFGPALAAKAITDSVAAGKLLRKVPVINLGDGTNEHPTQALGDLFTIYRRFQQLNELRIVVVGDHEHYRVFHSLLLGATAVNMRVVAVETAAAPVPDTLSVMLGDNLERTDDLDGAMREADILYMGRNPDEYAGDDTVEQLRSRRLATAFERWQVDYDRLQQMPADSMVLHPRPRGSELQVSADADPRTRDVEQMVNMTFMRMAVVASHMGASLRSYAELQHDLSN